MTTEKNFEEKVKKFLKDEYCRFVKYWGGGEFTKAGVPDILVCCNGSFIGVEVKAPNKKPRPLQKARHRLLKKLGFKVYVLDDAEQIGGIIDEIRTA